MTYEFTETPDLNDLVLECGECGSNRVAVLPEQNNQLNSPADGDRLRFQCRECDAETSIDARSLEP
jgi:hypothetical protein